MRCVSHIDGTAHSCWTGEFSNQNSSYFKILWIAWLTSDVRWQEKTSVGPEAKKLKNYFQQYPELFPLYVPLSAPLWIKQKQLKNKQPTSTTQCVTNKSVCPLQINNFNRSWQDASAASVGSQLGQIMLLLKSWSSDEEYSCYPFWYLSSRVWQVLPQEGNEQSL